MSRMWLTDPKLLCDDHLLGEHAELHQIVGSLRNHPHGQAIVDGHAARGQVDTTLINDRHDELAAELERRNYDHDSPLEYGPEEYQAGVGVIDVAANRKELRERCDACAERMGVVV